MTSLNTLTRHDHLNELYSDVLEAIGGLEETWYELPTGSEAEKYIGFLLEKFTLRVKAIEEAEAVL